MGPFFCTKNEKKNDIEENKFNERFGECMYFYIKRPTMEHTLMQFHRGLQGSRIGEIIM